MLYKFGGEQAALSEDHLWRFNAVRCVELYGWTYDYAVEFVTENPRAFADMMAIRNARDKAAPKPKQ